MGQAARPRGELQANGELARAGEGEFQTERALEGEGELEARVADRGGSARSRASS